MKLNVIFPRSIVPLRRFVRDIFILIFGSLPLEKLF